MEGKVMKTRKNTLIGLTQFSGSPGTAARRLIAFLCAELLLGWSAGAQGVVQCQPTAPFANPQFADGNSGFSPNTSASAAARNFAVGDINGDGNDELVTV